MEKKKEQEKMPVSAQLKACRVIGIVLMVAAIAYLVWPGDFDHKGSFMRPERRYIRRQLYALSSLFALLALCWTILMAFTK